MSPISLSGSDPAGFESPPPSSGLAGDDSHLPSPRSASLERVFGADLSGLESPTPETGPASDDSQPRSPIWGTEVHSTDESFVCSTVPPNPNSSSSLNLGAPWGDTFVPCTFQDLVPSVGANSSAEKCDGEVAGVVAAGDSEAARWADGRRDLAQILSGSPPESTRSDEQEEASQAQWEKSMWQMLMRIREKQTVISDLV